MANKSKKAAGKMTRATAPKAATAIRKKNRPTGQYPCPFEHDYKAFPTKQALIDHLASEHYSELFVRHGQLATPE